MGAFLEFVGCVCICWTIFASSARPERLRFVVGFVGALLAAMGLGLDPPNAAVWLILFGVLFAGLGIAKKGYRAAGIGSGLVLLVIGASFMPGTSRSQRTAVAAAPSPAPVHAFKAAPTPRPTRSPKPTPPPPPPTPTPNPILQEKHDFIASVDESISGPMIEGNPYKYVGDNVDLRCTVENIPDPSMFNAACGQDDDGTDAIIVVQYDDTSSLDKGQSVRVLGTVVTPMQGTNAMGGSMNFPTVEAHFME